MKTISIFLIMLIPLIFITKQIGQKFQVVAETGEIAASESLIIYPNPASIEVNIEIADEYSSGAVLFIEDQNSKRLFSLPVKGKTLHTLQLDRRFVEGNYIVTLSKDGKKQTGSFSVRE